MRARPESHAEARPAGSVLVTDDVDGGNRSSVAAVRALALAGYRPFVTVSTARSQAAASRHCAGALRVPPPSDPSYGAVVRDHLRHGDHLAVLPASDAALLALGCPGAALVDKLELGVRARAVGLRVPESITVDSVQQLLDRADELPFPLVVKPAVKRRGALPARRLDRPHDVRGLLGSSGALVVQPFEQAPMRSMSGVVHEGRLLAAVHQRYERIWPRDAGVACAAVTVAPDPALEASAVRLLSGHNGVFQMQLAGDVLLDVNPRVYGSMPLALAAGVNLPAIAMDAHRGAFASLARSHEGVRYRWLEGDLRHLLSRVRSDGLSLGHLAREARPRRGTAHSTESLRDPRPMLVRLGTALRTGRR